MRAVLAAVLALLVLPAAAGAAPSLVKVGDFDQPVHVAAPPGDASRLFVVEKPGRVQVLVNGQRRQFLDITAAVNDSGNEQGLLSIAFAPDYATSGLFYVFYTGGTTGPGPLIVAQGQRAPTDPDRGALTGTVFSVQHPDAQNHNGGQLAFGPDGFLYASTGDGGSTPATAQDLAVNLGKILRVEPRLDATPAVWASGLRNPWRFSFDRQTGTMVIGDVGEGTNEEISVAPAGGGNFGWNACEGDEPDCPVGSIRPVLTLPHAAPFNYSSVIGGFVLRDPGVPSLFGRYVFGDLAKDRVLSAALGVESAPRPEPALPVSSPSSFGEDACGRVYVASLGDNTVSRIQEGASACPAGAAPPTTPPAGAAPDTDGCGIGVRRKRTQRIAPRGRRFKLVLRAAERCTVTLRAKRFRTRRVVLAAGTRRVVRITPTRKGLKRMRRALADRRRIRLTIRIATRDAAGNAAVRRVRARLR